MGTIRHPAYLPNRAGTEKVPRRVEIDPAEGEESELVMTSDRWILAGIAGLLLLAGIVSFVLYNCRR